MQQSRRGGNGWIGWLIFIVLVFGSRFLPPVAGWLSQVTGLPISTPLLIGSIVGLGVILTIASSVLQEFNRGRSSNETRLPTGLPPASPPPTVQPPRSGSAFPPQSSTAQPRVGGQPKLKLPTGDQRLPGPPRFEPIIDPRVLTFGIFGLLLFGGFFLAVLLLVNP